MSEKRSGSAGVKKTRSKHGKLKKAALITVIALLSLLLAAGAVLGVLFMRYYNMLDVQHRRPEDSSIHYDESALSALESTPETVPDDDPDNPYNPNNPSSPFYTGSETMPHDTPADSSTSGPAETSSPESTASPIVTTPITLPPVVTTAPKPETTSDIIRDKGIINVLLIGADYETRYGNSDAIIVVSINNVDKRLTLTSIMRDTEAYFPGIQNGQTVIWRDKISNAHAYGGPKLLINAIETNFGIRIDNYAEVHYEEFIKVFEAIGGIDIVMNAEEVEAFNFECAQKIPADSAGKVVTLNAEQALSYARMRHLSGSDFGRTYRHRNVLMAAFNKVKTMSVGRLDNLLTTLFPIIETDISIADCFTYAAGVANYAKYSVETFRIPMDGYYTYESNNLCIRGYNKTVTMNMWREQVAGTR